jgi:hypothetical protein
LIDVTPVGRGCSYFAPNVQQPPPDDELHLAFGVVLQKWMNEQPVRVRATLPLVKDGNTVALFVWHDPVPAQGER